MSDKTYKYILDFAAKTDKFTKQVSGVEGLLKSAAVAAGALFAADKIFDAAGAAGDYAAEISSIRQNIEKLQGIQGAALNEATGGAKALADAYAVDVNESIIASNVLMKTFRDSSADAFNVLNKGFASTANSNGDFLKQVSEYSPHFKEAGLAASEMVAVIAESNKMGIFDDKAADSIKESSLRLREMTQSTKDALGGIGLSSTQIQKDISSGAKSMFDVMQDVSRQLQTLPKQSPAVGAALADIFGGPGEDGIAFIRTLADINTNLDEVVTHSGASATAQKEWANQLKEFHTLSADVFKDWNKWILDIKSKALSFASGFVTNMDEVVDVLKIGAAGLIAYKTATILASVGTANYSRIMVRARKAQQALNLAMKSNPIGLIAAVLATAAAAYLTYSIHIDGATASQKKFNEAQEEGSKLLTDVSSVESTYKIINNLNRRQLEDFKARAQQQLLVWEDVQKKVTETTYQEYKKRKSAITKEMDETVKKLVSSGDLEESEAKKQAEATAAYKLSQLRRWFNDTVAKQNGVTSTEITENQKRLKSYVSTADEMLKVSKATKKEIAKAPSSMEMPKIDLGDDEVDYDPFDMSDADGRAVMYSASLGELNEKIRQSAQYNAALGSSNNDVKDQIDLTKDAIKSLIEEGFNASDPAIQGLMANLDQLQNRYKNSNAGFMDWVGNMQQGLSTVQQGISNITSLGDAFESLSEKQKDGGASILDYMSTLLQVGSSILGTIQVVDTLSKAVKAKEAVDVAAAATTVTTEAAKSAAVLAGAAATAASAAITVTAKTTEATTVVAANVAEGTSSAVAGAAALPFPASLIAMGVAAVGALAIFGGLPKFANGGVVSGPTYGLIGEYPGATNNPELIAPASKMMGYIRQAVGESGGGGGNFSFRFEDGALVAYLNHIGRKVGGFA